MGIVVLEFVPGVIADRFRSMMPLPAVKQGSIKGEDTVAPLTARDAMLGDRDDSGIDRNILHDHTPTPATQITRTEVRANTLTDRRQDRPSYSEAIAYSISARSY